MKMIGWTVTIMMMWMVRTDRASIVPKGEGRGMEAWRKNRRRKMKIGECVGKYNEMIRVVAEVARAIKSDMR